MSSVLQVQQLYTAGIPLLEAYLLPMANNRTHKERLSQVRTKWPLATWSKLQTSNFHFALTQRVWHTYIITTIQHNHSHKKFKVDPGNKSLFPPSTSLWSSATHTRGATHPTVAGVRSLNSQVLSLFHVCAPSDLRYLRLYGCNRRQLTPKRLPISP